MPSLGGVLLMGINAEMVRLVAGLRSRGVLSGDSVIEIGAQDVCAARPAIASILEEYGFKASADGHWPTSAADLYACLGFSRYLSVDANPGPASRMLDLNQDFHGDYGFLETFDLVTNLGTSEHCFNQLSVFKNLHDLCKVGGLMIHALTAQGNVNHGFYNYHPRFVADLAAANSYDCIRLAFTVDYKPQLFDYTLEEFRKWDSHDLLMYAILRRTREAPFCTPFDGMFAASNKLSGYSPSAVDPLVTEFAPYLKTGSWHNTLGLQEEQEVVPVPRNIRALLRRLFGKGTSS